MAFCDEIIPLQTVTLFVSKMRCEILCCLYTEGFQQHSAIVIAVCRFHVHFRQRIEPKFVLKGQCHEIFDFRFFHIFLLSS
jgi:hypothetical protein